MKLFSRKSKVSTPSLQEDAKSGVNGQGGNAKDLTTPTPAQIQSAKDFIWNWMDEGNRKLIIGMATLSTHERHGLYVKQIFAEMEAKEESGIILHERMIIGHSYSDKPQYLPSTETT